MDAVDEQMHVRVVAITVRDDEHLVLLELEGREDAVRDAFHGGTTSVRRGPVRSAR